MVYRGDDACCLIRFCSSFRSIAPFSRRKGARIPWHAAPVSLRRATLLERFRPAPRRSQPDFGAAGLWRLAGLGGARRIAHRRAWAGSARSRCGWRRPPPRCARRRNCAIAFSIKRVAAIANPGRLFARRDVDAYDAICDHLLVLDHDARDGQNANRPAVVGTYRLLRQPVAEDYGGFYTVERIRHRRR